MGGAQLCALWIFFQAEPVRLRSGLAGSRRLPQVRYRKIKGLKQRASQVAWHRSV
jgi:hypothetical protein